MSQTSNTTNTSTTVASATCAKYDPELEKVKKNIEKKGEQELQALFKEKGVNGSSFTSVLTALGSGIITEQSLSNIMQKGFDTFKEENGRGMTYSEMREMYG
jgi:hypothetical protein